MSQRRSSARDPSQTNETRTVIKDEQGGIALITETNHEWAEEYKNLLMEFQRLKDEYDAMEQKYQETQKENVKVKRHMELSEVKFTREKNGWMKQKEDLNGQIEKLRKELREKSVKVINSLIYLLHKKTGHNKNGRSILLCGWK